MATGPDTDTAQSALHSILVLCTHNAVRSPICAAMLRNQFGNTMYVASAGTQAASDPDYFTASVMSEIDMDIGDHQPINFADMDEDSYDLIIALSRPAAELARKIAQKQPLQVEYWDTEEPPGLMAGLPRDRMMEAYRRVRDELRLHIANRFGRGSE
jgi:protein-tyrosine-phosphatase